MLDADLLEIGLSAGLCGGDGVSLGLLSTTSAGWERSAAGLALSSHGAKAREKTAKEIKTVSTLY